VQVEVILRTPNGSFHKIEPAKISAYMREHPQAFLREVSAEFSCCIEDVRKA